MDNLLLKLAMVINNEMYIKKKVEFNLYKKVEAHILSDLKDRKNGFIKN